MAEAKPDFQAQLRALQETFARELPGKLDDLEAAWTAAEPLALRLESVKRQAHGLAGSGGTFGFPELSLAARALERRIQAIQDEGRPPEAGPEADLTREIRALRAEAPPESR